MLNIFDRVLIILDTFLPGSVHLTPSDGWQVEHIYDLVSLKKGSVISAL